MRESGSAVPSFLRELDVRVQFEHLEIWDYVLTSESAVGRKIIRDLISSIYDGKLFAQCSALPSHYPKAFIIVEGNLKRLDSVVTNPKVVFGALVHLQLSSSVRVLHTRSPRDTALVLTVMGDHLTRVKKATLQIQRLKKAVELEL